MARSRLRVQPARRRESPRHFQARAEAARLPENARNFAENAQWLDAPEGGKHRTLGYHMGKGIPRLLAAGLAFPRPHLSRRYLFRAAASAGRVCRENTSRALHL